MTHYSTEPRIRKYVKEYEFLSFPRNLSSKYGKQLLDTAAKTRFYTLKTVSKKVVNKRAEVTGEFIEKKLSNKFVKPDENS